MDVGVCSYFNVMSQIGEEVVKVFWLNSPAIYFKSVMVQMMVVSCYMSLWLTNYCAVASRMQHNKEFWVIVSLLPAVLCIALNFYIVRCASLLKVCINGCLCIITLAS